MYEINLNNKVFSGHNVYYMR